MATFRCACKKELSLADMLDAVAGFDPSLDVVIVKCPACAATSEVRLETGAVGWGYVYAAGAPHFVEMARDEVADLRASRDGAALVVSFEGRSWTF